MDTCSPSRSWTEFGEVGFDSVTQHQNVPSEDLCYIITESFLEWAIKIFVVMLWKKENQSGEYNSCCMLCVQLCYSYVSNYASVKESHFFHRSSDGKSTDKILWKMPVQSNHRIKCNVWATALLISCHHREMWAVIYLPKAMLLLQEQSLQPWP